MNDYNKNDSKDSTEDAKGSKINIGEYFKKTKAKASDIVSKAKENEKLNEIKAKAAEKFEQVKSEDFLKKGEEFFDKSKVLVTKGKNLIEEKASEYADKEASPEEDSIPTDSQNESVEVKEKNRSSASEKTGIKNIKNSQFYLSFII